MKRKFLKILSVLLVFALLCCLAPAVSFAATVNETEKNDDYRTANKIPVGDTVNGNIADSWDEDWFCCEPAADGYLTLRFEHHLVLKENAYWQVSVYRFTNKLEEIFSDTMEATDLGLIPRVGVEKGGIYYVEIDGDNYGNVDGVPYSLKVTLTETPYWEKEPNDSYSAATQMDLGKTYGGNVWDKSDEDYFRLTPDKNGYLSIDFGYEPVKQEHTYWTVTVYRFTNQLEEIFSKDLEASAVPSMPHIGVEGGATYYIEVDGDNYGNVDGRDYSLTAAFTATEYWEAEKNDDYKTAKRIQANRTYGGMIGDTADEDWFKLTPEQNGYITIGFTFDLLKEERAYWDVTVYRFTNRLEEIYEKTVYTTDAAAMPRIGVQKGADYYIEIDGDNYGNVNERDYHLTAAFAVTEYWEADPNEGYQTANPITLDTPYGGMIGSTADEDWFKLVPGKDGYVTLAFGHEILNVENAYWNVTVYRFTNQLERIAEVWPEASGTEGVPAFGIEAGGIYYVSVDGDGYGNVNDLDYTLTARYSETLYLLGDLDFDGKVTASDARLALRGAVGLETFDATLTRIGDVDFDKKITASDARLILRAAVGLETLG